MSNYTPDRWVVIELSDKDTTIKKVLAGWYGGYLGSDSWRISSGIAEEADCGEYYEFTNHSGSVYQCRKGSYGMSGLMGSIHNEMVTKYADNYKVKVLEEYDTIKPDVSN
jgi:sulfatase maturation enzyme AslB (radical SAM superfamily)